MKQFVLILAGLLVGCGTVGGTTPMPSTMKCLHHAEALYDLSRGLEKRFGYAVEDPEKVYQRMRNECMWAKAQAKKN